jgi:tRNA (guanine37-N1)-methyltransferase
MYEACVVSGHGPPLHLAHTRNAILNTSVSLIISYMAELVSEQGKDGGVEMVLDRSLLKDEISLVALKTLTQDIAKALKQLKDLLLNRPRFSNVAEPPSNRDADIKESKDKPSKLILLNEKVNSTNLDNVTEEGAACLKSWLASHQGELVEYKLCLSYANYSYEEVLQRLLPSGVEIPSSFETIGHIAHLNLREAHLPFKFLIAQVMLDKFTAIKTVINKIGEGAALKTH